MELESVASNFYLSASQRDLQNVISRAIVQALWRWDLSAFVSRAVQSYVSISDENLLKTNCCSIVSKFLKNLNAQILQLSAELKRTLETNKIMATVNSSASILLSRQVHVLIWKYKAQQQPIFPFRDGSYIFLESWIRILDSHMSSSGNGFVNLKNAILYIL